MSGLGDAAWDAFVRSHPAGSFFHLSAWKGVAREVFGHRPHYLEVRTGDTLQAILPLVETRSRLFGNALISNAFCIGGGPLANDEASRRQILDDAEQLGRQLGVDYVELRDTPAAADGWITRDDLYANFARPITRVDDDNFRQIPKRQRAVLRKALATEMTATIDSSPADFFKLYARTMRNHGTPALPRRFFDQLTKVFGSDCEIMTVRSGGEPVSSVISYFFNDRVMPYYTGSAGDARGSGANDLLYWSVMCRAAERGVTMFDFGRSKVGTGPYAFKRNWGFEPRAIVHQYRMMTPGPAPNINPTNPRYATLIQLWRRLPLPVATAISPLISRSLG